MNCSTPEEAKMICDKNVRAWVDLNGHNISLLFFRTSMGENVLEYDGVLLDEGEDDPYFEDEDCSSSEDEFLEIPLNDRFFYKH